MTKEQKLENIPEEEVPASDEVEKQMKEKSSPQITNPVGDEELDKNPKRKQVNKKLSAMSKNTKEEQKIIQAHFNNSPRKFIKIFKH